MTETDPACTAPAHAWDRLPGEGDEDYTKFFRYLHLGPGRSVHRAFRLMHQGANGDGRRRASGGFHRLSQEYCWRRRATQYDLHHLLESGREALAKYLASINATAARTLERLTDGGVKPTSWSDVLQTIRVLSEAIPPQKLEAVAAADR